MDDILNASRELGRRIGESEVYTDYAAALAIVKEDSSLWTAIEEFKRVQLEYSRSDNNLDSEKHLSKLYFDLCINPKAARFLEAEKKMLALMLEVHENLWTGCEVIAGTESEHRQ